MFGRRRAGKRRAAARAGSLYDAGHLHPLIDKTFPFDRTLEALAYVEHSRANGKLVITLE